MLQFYQGPVLSALQCNPACVSAACVSLRMLAYGRACVRSYIFTYCLLAFPYVGSLRRVLTWGSILLSWRTATRTKTEGADFAYGRLLVTIS